MPYAQTEIVIKAPAERVWEVMLDVHRYSEWNPFINKIDCTVPAPVLGTDLTLHVQFKGGQKVATVERITQLDPPSRHADGIVRGVLEYQFLGFLHTFYLVRGRRSQVVEQRDSRETLYRTREHLYGLLGFAAPIKAVQDGFERHASALKLRCESMSP